MHARSSTLVTFFTAAAIVACSDHTDPVSTDRGAAGLHASPSGGISGSAGPSADLQMTGSASTGSPFTDSLFSYTFQFKNNGPDSAPHATIVDTLPASVTYMGILNPVPNNACCVPTLIVNRVVATCDFGTLKKGATASMQVLVSAPDSAAPVSNTANAVSTLLDPVLTNNAITITVQAQVAKPARLAPAPTPTPTPVATVAFTTLPAEQFGVRLRRWSYRSRLPVHTDSYGPDGGPDHRDRSVRRRPL
jgi:hypothetical protein